MAPRAASRAVMSGLPPNVAAALLLRAAIGVERVNIDQIATPTARVCFAENLVAR